MTPQSHGNIGIAAHRDGYFRPLKDIQEGALLTLESVKSTHTYRVTKISIVTPQDVQVIAPTQVPSITLVTCYPFYFLGSAPKRYIVRAEQVD